MTAKVVRNVAAIYDIHGNLPALHAVLEKFKEVQPDLIVIGGDIVSGPMPQETLERLLSLGNQARFIRGNGDREVVMVFDGKPLPPTMSEEVRRVTEWVAGQLSSLQRDFLAQQAESITLQIEGLGDVLFCHATPHSDEEIFTPMSPMERLNGIFSGVEEEFVVCGHTHMQFEHRLNKVRIVNAGSVGMPYAEQPGAYWLLIGPQGVDFRRTTYDFEEAAKDIIASGYPQAQEFAGENVLAVPTAAEATKFFERIVKKESD